VKQSGASVIYIERSNLMSGIAVAGVDGPWSVVAEYNADSTACLLTLGYKLDLTTHTIVQYITIEVGFDEVLTSLRPEDDIRVHNAFDTLGYALP
jgi:hypothetical protein